MNIRRRRRRAKRLAQYAVSSMPRVATRYSHARRLHALTALFVGADEEVVISLRTASNMFCVTKYERREDDGDASSNDL